MKKIKQGMKYFLGVFPRLFYFVYLFNHFVSGFYPRTRYSDKLIIMNIQKGWILEKICNVLSDNYQGEFMIHSSIKKIPKAGKYFFPNYRAFLYAALYNPYLLGTKIYVYFTHYEDMDFLSEREVSKILNFTEKIYAMNQNTEKFLIANGTLDSKIEVIYAGVDTDMFKPVGPASGRRPAIGFCLRYKDIETYNARKNYDLLVEVIKQIDFADVILLGKGWKDFSRFSEIKDLDYFEYAEVEYSEYPIYYNKMDVYVSLSTLEGGPIPLLEAMACNVFPVVTDTGFAPDIIKNGETGILLTSELDKNSVINSIRLGIEKSRSVDVSKSVSSLTWKRFAQNIIKDINQK